MKWTQASRTWTREDDQARVMDCSSAGLPYFAMWYRERPGIGPWLEVRGAGGRVTFRRSPAAAFEYVGEVIEGLNRKEAA